MNKFISLLATSAMIFSASLTAQTTQPVPAKVATTQEAASASVGYIAPTILVVSTAAILCATIFCSHGGSGNDSITAGGSGTGGTTGTSGTAK